MPEIPDPTPDLEDLLQEAPVVLTVPVRGEGQFLVTQLPARRVQYATDLVPAANWTALMPETPKRSRSVLMSTDKGFYVSATGTGTGMLWPANQPLEVRHSQRVYVMAADPAGATISHLTELWAD